MRNNYWCFIIAALLFSCDSKQVFDQYQSVDAVWNKNDIIAFNFIPQDTTSAYNTFVTLRNTNDYKYSNLFLLVAINYPNGKVIKDTLEYKMAKPNGEFLGNGFTDVKENKLWHKEQFVFNESGNYVIEIQHAMRQNGVVKGVENLEGVTDVGFRIEYTK